MENWKQYLPEYFANNSNLTLGVVAVGLLLVLILLWKILTRKPKVIKAFSDTSGAVYVSTHAITDMVRAVCDHVEGISRPRVKLKEKRGVTHLDLHLRLESGSRIREIRDGIREHLHRTLKDNLGIERLGNITVFISEYKSGAMDTIAAQEMRTQKEEVYPYPEDPEPQEPEKEKPVTAADLLEEKELTEDAEKEDREERK